MKVPTFLLWPQAAQCFYKVYLQLGLEFQFLLGLTNNIEASRCFFIRNGNVLYKCTFLSLTILEKRKQAQQNNTVQL